MFTNECDRSNRRASCIHFALFYYALSCIVIIAGIGYDIAKALAAGGAETIALSRTQADLDRLKAEVFHSHSI